MRSRRFAAFGLLFLAGLIVGVSGSCSVHGHSTWAIVLSTAALWTAWLAGNIDRRSA